ncbi:MAG: hypothetical protein IPP90_23355 [Gemmatimonadaceae bacterium]|nr:hypothetical protein [Gemmatimonadaceae bacterium]
MNPVRTMIAVALICAIGCDTDSPSGPPANGVLAVGTWGGDSAGVIVTDTLLHVHIGCTYGDIPRHVTLDTDGRFTVSGSFLLRAYPVAIGPTMPAQFVGRVSGSTLIITVTVNDTIDRKVVIRGPAVVQFGKEPKMSNCPICRTPGDRESARTMPTRTHWYDRIIALFARRAPDTAATLPTRSPPANPPAGNTPRQ